MAKSTRSRPNGLAGPRQRGLGAGNALFLPQSLFYQEAMQRFVALIAVIFAFAALAGTATAHAHRYVSTPIVVLNHVDDNNVSIPVIVQVQRGDIDLGAGIIMPCGSYQAIAATPPTIPPAPPSALPRPSCSAAEADWPAPVPQRPPRSA